MENRPALFARRTNWNLTPNPLSEALEERRAAGKPILDLTASDPTECGFTYGAAAILAALQTPAVLSYAPDPRGLLAARQAVCNYYAARGDSLSADSVILTTSTSEAYSFVFRLLCEPGDEVLVPQPSYPLFDFLADLHDVRLVRYPLLYDHGWQIDFHAMRQTLTERTRAVIVVNPNNPTGNFCKAAEMAELNDVCTPQQIVIIADEVFLDYSLQQELPKSFVANDSAATFTMSGLSKIAGLPQFKASWLAVSGPAAWKRDALERLEVIADTFLSMNAPVQLAMPKLLELRCAFQEQLQARVRENLAELDRQLAAPQGASKTTSCARLEFEGGWYAVLALPASYSGDEVALRLITEHGVYVHPGHFYEFPGD
ncbi:MAG TPA: pyridoxal phosphate-dependent aminotransferase, partial [Candidatus Dormibacteraeota bacterium]|nr:pyridoxal phosphate-dependent aminotransferase [Candidatus Dormibacteraeota bacterium]